MSRNQEVGTNIAVIAGLGNPGRQYESTRHNAGFLVVERLAREFGITLQERKFRASWGTGEIRGRKILLFRPLTFMNRSGEAVGEVLRYFGWSAEQLLVVHDDLDLPLGRIRLAGRGSAGGHRGIASILEHLGDPNFARLKLGIGRPLHREPVESYVLQPPYAEQVAGFETMIHLGSEAVEAVLTEGLASAMNRFNKREPAGTGDCAPVCDPRVE